MTILIVTVGGSPQPILTAIKSLKPDSVLFICTDGPHGSISQVLGEGKPCKIIQNGIVKEEQPNIIVQAGLADRFDQARDLLIVEPDDLAECHSRIREALATLKREHPHATFKADYTGGTKTMTAALVLAATDCGVDLFLTTGRRDNVVKVERGESTEKVDLSQITLERSLELYVPESLAQYDYGSAICRLENLLHGIVLSKDQKVHVKTLLSCCQGFECWDRFDHAGAIDYLVPHLNHQELHPAVFFLKRILMSRAQMDPGFDASKGLKGHGYEVVLDLLLNSERRAHQKRYDDAVGRLYRALELLAQMRLKNEHGILTGNVDLALVPEGNKECYLAKCNEKGVLQLGLRESYELLALLGDLVGIFYKERSDTLIDALKMRNNSLFAHGFRPVSEADYKKVSALITSFIHHAILSVAGEESVKPPVQFPREIRLGGPQAE